MSAPAHPTATIDSLVRRLRGERVRAEAALVGLRRQLQQPADPDLSDVLDQDLAVTPVGELERHGLRATLAATAARLRDLDAALARVDDGSYGWCEGCGGRIPLARLRALPEAARCVECQCRANDPFALLVGAGR